VARRYNRDSKGRFASGGVRMGAGTRRAYPLSKKAYAEGYRIPNTNISGLRATGGRGNVVDFKSSGHRPPEWQVPASQVRTQGAAQVEPAR
jgi:hypothetical protein